MKKKKKSARWWSRMARQKRDTQATHQAEGKQRLTSPAAEPQLYWTCINFFLLISLFFESLRKYFFPFPFFDFDLS